MRPPRYRFPEEVRSATRLTASRMVAEERVAQSPEQLEAWIAENADVSATLQAGGYGTAFAAEDLYPLLQAMLEHRGIPGSAAAETPSHNPRRRWVGIAVVVIVAAALLLLVWAWTAGA